MDVCRDKGAIAYERYIAAAVMGRNLQTLGTVLLAKERDKLKDDNLLLSLVG
jgi:GTP-sensing pleiotropic transcriptional regulator CodY